MSERSVGLWTDGEITIVLAQVVAAYWEGVVNDEWQWCSKEDSTRFVISTIPTSYILETGDYVEDGVDFLRALNLYWETRV